MENQTKIKVAVLMGGRSAEHEISLLSAKNVIEALDINKYEIVPIGIDKHGKWFLHDKDSYLANTDNPKLVRLIDSHKEVVLRPGGDLINLSNGQKVLRIDVVFPVLHGTFGEDGTMQGFLKIINLPFVGPSVLGSAAAMDKDVTKRLLTQAGISNTKFLVFKKEDKDTIDYNEVVEILGSPLFIKPANLGSSVGINKVSDKQDFNKAIGDAFKFDNKILIEEFIEGKEIECSVLGNASPKVSLPGRVIPKHEFYSYDAKYIDEDGAILEAPTKLSESVVKKVQELAVRVFKTLECEGMARVDFFLRGEDELFVNEINTIPGFTKISMYPKLWEVSGISYSDLIDELIQLAIDRFQREQKLQTFY